MFVRSWLSALVMLQLVLTLIQVVQGRPRRRFCENYPFAPRCLGVSAKRSGLIDMDTAKDTDVELYNNILKSVIEEMNKLPLARDLQKRKVMYDDDPYYETYLTLSKNSKRNSLNRLPYMSSDEDWSGGFEDDQPGL